MSSTVVSSTTFGSTSSTLTGQVNDSSDSSSSQSSPHSSSQSDKIQVMSFAIAASIGVSILLFVLLLFFIRRRRRMRVIQHSTYPFSNDSQARPRPCGGYHRNAGSLQTPNLPTIT
ncbi:hypothetical protein M408DRAFT_294124 [Serendipita vermifera MAFF 305830]|uniref:Uncharacterized protein n=1 Tax=Serendipita vermifera MAFF 305830 TaxID=933852 RepID=A0A0C3BFC7_SERVB|nr:hypothetical protein M408DRAFT_294124 [Serendipita vermifera MAFF 305830]